MRLEHCITNLLRRHRRVALEAHLDEPAFQHRHRPAPSKQVNQVGVAGRAENRPARRDDKRYHRCGADRTPTIVGGWSALETDKARAETDLANAAVAPKLELSDADAPFVAEICSRLDG